MSPSPIPFHSPPHVPGSNAKCYLLDQSRADTRAYFWTRLNSGYYSHGIKIYWLDASEPEISTKDARAAALNSYYSVGSTNATGMMFPYVLLHSCVLP